MSIKERLDEIRQVVPEVMPGEALVLQKLGAIILDVRDADEVSQGSPVGAERVSRSFLEWRVADVTKDTDSILITMCASGQRSLFAAETLHKLGYGNVKSMLGGFTQWKKDDLPFEFPQSLNNDSRERYARQLVIPQVGEQGQLKLNNSNVLLVGAGGLGSPIAYYLAAAGVGTIGIVDNDMVDRSNLQRQILHTDRRVGTLKTDSAEKTLTELNPTVHIHKYSERLTPENIEKLFNLYDVIVDGSDNFPTRYLINDACVKLKLPNVYGSVFRFKGQVSVFWPAFPERRGPCYRCLYSEPPPEELTPSCADAGVLGVLPGTIGLLQATEVIKIILGIGDILVGRLISYDALVQSFDEFKVQYNPNCEYCGDGKEFPGYIDYEDFCSLLGGS